MARLVIFGILLVIIAGVNCMRDEWRLQEHLMQQPGILGRPTPVAGSSTTPVQFMLSLLTINNIDFQKQTMATSVYLVHEWQDDRLKWDPADFGEAKTIYMDASSVWTPDISVMNSVSAPVLESSQVSVRYGGLVQWEVPALLTTDCTMDVEYFPFDLQECQMVFGSVSMPSSVLNISLMTEHINLDSYMSNLEWRLIDAPLTRAEFFYAAVPEERYVTITARIKMQRQSFYYEYNLLLPAVLLSVLLLLSFCSSWQNQLLLQCLVLLLLRLLMADVGDLQPRSSLRVSIISRYLTCLLVLDVVAMVISVILGNIASRKSSPPAFVSGVAFKRLQKVLFIDTPEAPKIEGNEIEAKGAEERGKGSEDAATESQKGSGWESLALVFSRICFWIFLIIVSIATAVVFAPKSRMIHDGLNAG